MDPAFISGVIEGFYGPPWSLKERTELFQWMAGAQLNTYLYAPKDDLKQRANWREPYTRSEADELRDLIRSCGQAGIRFVYAISPGLDLAYSRKADRNALLQRGHQMVELGCAHFCLLFDDIPDQMNPDDLARFGSLASAQADVANELFAWSRQRTPGNHFFFCPTPYCGRMAEANLGGEGYLEKLGAELHPEIQIFWTGLEIISRQITPADISHLTRILRRKPLIWDNLHANDYDGRRFFCGPYAGREPDLRNAVSGILLNPNTEFPLNYVPIRTLGEFLHAQRPSDSRQAYCNAMREWAHEWQTIRGPVELEDLILFADCFYLPYENGPEAAALLDSARSVLSRQPSEWKLAAQDLRSRADRLRQFCMKLPDLVNRPLFHALSRRVWDLREELDLLLRYIDFKSDPANESRPFRSDFHLPHTFRGGFIANLQKLLDQHPDGTFEPPTPND